jgi:hypothetical protein
MSNCVVIRFKHCNLVLSKKTCDYDDSWSYDFYFERPGYEKIEFDTEDLTTILNCLMECQDVINSNSIVDSSSQLISNGRSLADPHQTYLLTTKINDKVKISLMGFLTGHDDLKTKQYEIKFDKNDDVFHACGEYLKFLRQDKRSKIGIMML